MSALDDARLPEDVLPDVDRLLDLLEQMWAQQRHVARLLERQREALLARHLTLLDQVNTELASAADAIRALEAARLEATASVATALRMPPEVITARWLREHLDEQRAQTLGRLAAGLAEQLQFVRGLQQGNAELAERGLAYVAETIRLLGRAMEPGYQPPGGKGAQAAGAMWFDGQA